MINELRHVFPNERHATKFSISELYDILSQTITSAAKINFKIRKFSNNKTEEHKDIAQLRNFVYTINMTIHHINDMINLNINRSIPPVAPISFWKTTLLNKLNSFCSKHEITFDYPITITLDNAEDIKTHLKEILVRAEGLLTN